MMISMPMDHISNRCGRTAVEKKTCALRFPVQSGFPLILFRIEGLVEVAQMAADSAAGGHADGAVLPYDEAMGMVSNSWKSVRFMPHLFTWLYGYRSKLSILFFGPANTRYDEFWVIVAP